MIYIIIQKRETEGFFTILNSILIKAVLFDNFLPLFT